MSRRLNTKAFHVFLFFKLIPLKIRNVEDLADKGKTISLKSTLIFETMSDFEFEIWCSKLGTTNSLV